MCLLAAAIMLQSAFAQAVFADDSSTAVRAENASGEDNIDISVDTSGKSEGYSAVLYDNTNGLPTSEANAIAETSEGFIWIGSYSGLIRYDGNTFERINSTTGIASVVSLYVDNEDRLWIGTNDSGVAMMEKGEFTMFSKADGLGSDSVRSITEDTNGIIYVATTSGIAMIDKDMKLTRLDDSRLNDAYIRHMRLGNDGLIYGVTQTGDIFTLRNSGIVNFISSDKSGIDGLMTLLPDPERPGYVYLGTESSNVYYGKLGKKFTSKKVIDIAPLTYAENFEYFNGDIWACAGNGIGFIGEKGFVYLDNVPLNNSVSHVMTDYEGNLWFTSTRQGVMKIVRNQFADIFERYEIGSNVVNSTCMLGDNLYVATDTGLMVLGEDGVRTSMPLKKAVTSAGTDLGYKDLISMLDGCRIRSIVRDSRDRLWIATWQKYGMLCYDNGKLTVYNTDSGLFSDRIRVAAECRDGSILVANTGGVNLIRKGKVRKSYSEADGLANSEILTVVEADNGDIIMGSDGGGIYIISESGFRSIGKEDGLASDVIMRIKKDPIRNVFWIITSNSIAYMTSDYEVTTVKDFPYSNNFDIYINKAGEAWILSSNGIFVISADNLIENNNISPVYYGMENGLPGITTANSYSEITDSGDLYIASTTGVVKVNIDKPFETVSDLKISVPYIEADGRMLYPDEEGNFNIPSDIKKVTVYSYVYNYSLIDPKVTYYLKGFEQENATISRSEMVPVDYTNLRGGTYSFIIQLKDSLGKGNREMSVNIIKKKAYYEEIWFYVISLLILIALLIVVVGLYIRRKTSILEKKQRENMIFIREITEAFAKVIDMKDKYTNGHSARVARYTSLLSKELGYDEETTEKYYRIALLHDIGKIGIPPEVLNKKDKLTDEEYIIMKSHASLGYDTLKDISIMPELAIGAGAHHERPDGKGYPKGLKGDEIPRVAQIIAVADTFDAMYSTRPYRKRMNFDKVVSIIKDGAGSQFTGDVVDAFLRLVDKGEFKDPDDTGGGTTENIDNVNKGITNETEQKNS